MDSDTEEVRQKRVESNQPLVKRLEPIAITSKIFADLAIDLRRTSGVAKVANDLRCPAMTGSFIMEWEVSAFSVDDVVIQSWTVSITWLDESWVI